LLKFPDTLIFAQQAEFVGTPDHDNLANAQRKMKTDGQSKFPAFTAKLGTDVTLVGFEMSKQEALGWNGTNQFTAGYYFAMQERPGQLRFGADKAAGGAFTTWDNLSWDNFTATTQIINIATSLLDLPTNPTNGVMWGRSSADMVNILNQLPVLFLVHCKDMII
jgi:hypothetical protein